MNNLEVFALYDMHGNVYEWCEDYFGKYTAMKSLKYSTQTIRHLDEHRVLRGGSWLSFAGDCRSAFRNRDAPDIRGLYGCGVRVCLRLDLHYCIRSLSSIMILLQRFERFFSHQEQ